MSIGTYRNARFIRDRGIRRLQEYVQAGKISVHRAYGIAQEDDPTQNRLIDEYLVGGRVEKTIVARLINSARPEEVSFAALIKGFRYQIERLRTNQPVRELCDKLSQVLNEIERKLKAKDQVDGAKVEEWLGSKANEISEERADCAGAPRLQGLPENNGIDLPVEIGP